ncbi:MAG: penicillin-binding protein 1C [Hyphomicrobiaceae bacterium]
MALTAITAATVITATAFGALHYAKRALGPPPFAAADDVSTIVVDRNDRLLRPFTTKDGRWRLPVSVADVDQRYIAMLLAFEDRRFRAHGGVDVLSLGRAAFQLATNGRIVSGASTLTMQVARLLEGRHERTGMGKLKQIVRALQIEQVRSKDEILDLYLRMAPFGGNIEGARAASLAYFGKEPKRLSIGEAALLVALPQSPETRRPDRFAARARMARGRVLDRAVEAGVITAAEAEHARAEPVPTQRRQFPMLAPHLAETEVAAAPAASVHRTTLNRTLQQSLEALARERKSEHGPRLSTAIVVADHATGEVLARVGAADYFDADRFGSVDMASAVRSPGSTLKPLIYGLAFDLGLAHPETLIEDRAVRFGTWRPKNFDEDFHGTVTIRSALANSLNIPAVKVLDKVGPGRMLARLRRAGLKPQLPEATAPTLAMALGGLGMTLEDLVGAFTAFPRGGEPVPLVHRKADIAAAALALRRGTREAPSRRLMSPVASWYITDILKDAPPPANARSGRIAYKTGTSYGYRDAWAIGYDGRHVVGVWVGRPDNTSTPGLMGRNTAAPLLFDAFARISETPARLPPAPAGVLNVSGADLPPPLKRFAEHDTVAAEDQSSAVRAPAVSIAFPPDRAEVEIEQAAANAAPEPLLLKAEGGTLPLTWLADGQPIGIAAHRRDFVWQPGSPGFYKLSVIDAKGRVDRVTVRLR